MQFYSKSIGLMLFLIGQETFYQLHNYFLVFNIAPTLVSVPTLLWVRQEIHYRCASVSQNTLNFFNNGYNPQLLIIFSNLKAFEIYGQTSHILSYNSFSYLPESVFSSLHDYLLLLWMIEFWLVANNRK